MKVGTIASANLGVATNYPLDGEMVMTSDTKQLYIASGGVFFRVITADTNGHLNITTLPTSSAGLVTGDIWNDAGTLKII